MSRPGRGQRGRLVEKPKDFKRSLKKLLRFLKPFKLMLVFSILFSIIATFLNIIGPYFLGKITSQIQIDVTAGTSINFPKITKIGILLVSFYIMSSIFYFIQSILMNHAIQNIGKNLRTKMNKKINRLPLNYFDKNSYGEVLSRTTNDIDVITNSLNQIVSRVISAITTLISIIVIMLIMNRILTFIVVIFVPISFLAVSFIVKVSQKQYRSQQKNLGEMNSYIEETYSGHNVIKSFNAGNITCENFNNINENLYKSSWKSQFFSGMMFPIMRFFGNLSYLSIAVFGGFLAISGQILVGDIQSFLIYVRRFNEPISQIAELTGLVQSTVAASERVFDFLEAEELLTEKTNQKLENVKGDIQFKDVSFGYNPNKLVIKNFSLKVKEGQKIAIVGPTGAGKTTIVNLLMRFYEVDKGDILIDGISIKDISRENLREQFAMVLQDSWLFEGTIKENILYGLENISDEQLFDAAKTANVDHFIKSLPKGYEMFLDENVNISEGQKQLLTIARAVLRDAPILILDEATSSVDTRTEKNIQLAMDELMENRTSFIIAHRLSTIKNADLILVIKDGEIIEKGTHKQLIISDSYYKELYDAQFK